MRPCQVYTYIGWTDLNYTHGECMGIAHNEEQIPVVYVQASCTRDGQISSTEQKLQDMAS